MKKIVRTLLVAFFVFVMTATPTMAYNWYSFDIDQKSKSVEVGEKFTLTALGSGALLGKTTWNSTDESILKIESVESGKYVKTGYRVHVRAVGTGKASVVARNSKNSSVLSCSVTVGEMEEVQKDRPVITKAVSSGTSKAGKIKLEWSDVNGAEKYIVQISKNEDFLTLYRDATTKNTYYNTGWSYYRLSGFVELHYCRVKAVMTNGTESVWSDVVICTTE